MAQNYIARFRKSVVVLSSACMCWTLSVVPQPANRVQAASSNSQGWEIDYKSSFAGTVKIRFTDTAMNMKLEKMGLTVVAHAPKWNSLVYNEMNKKYMSMTDEQWKTKFASGLSKHKKAASVSLKPEYTKKTETIYGMKASKILLKEKAPDGTTDVSSEIWVTKGLDAPPQFKQFLSKALHVTSDFQGTPLRIKLNQKGELVNALEAYKIAKIKPDENEFKPLQGYKEVKNEINLMMDDDEGGGMMPSP